MTVEVAAEAGQLVRAVRRATRTPSLPPATCRAAAAISRTARSTCSAVRAANATATIAENASSSPSSPRSCGEMNISQAVTTMLAKAIASTTRCASISRGRTPPSPRRGAAEISASADQRSSRHPMPARNSDQVAQVRAAASP